MTRFSGCGRWSPSGSSCRQTAPPSLSARVWRRRSRTSGAGWHSPRTLVSVSGWTFPLRRLNCLRRRYMASSSHAISHARSRRTSPPSPARQALALRTPTGGSVLNRNLRSTIPTSSIPFCPTALRTPAQSTRRRRTSRASGRSLACDGRVQQHERSTAQQGEASCQAYRKICQV